MDPAAEFLGRLAENHNLSEATFLVDETGYLTALARCDLHGHLDHVERNLIEKWFQMLAMRIDRFHPLLQPATTKSTLDDRTPAEEVMNR